MEEGLKPKKAEKHGNGVRHSAPLPFNHQFFNPLTTKQKMRITGKITKIYPQRTGVGVKTGKPYTVTEVHFTWMDDISQRQGIVRCSTMQDLNMDRLK